MSDTDHLPVTDGWLLNLFQPLCHKSNKRSIYDNVAILQTGFGADGVRQMHFDNLDVTICPSTLDYWEVFVEWVDFPNEEYQFSTREEFQNWFNYLYSMWELKARPTSTKDWFTTTTIMPSTRTRQWNQIEYTAFHAEGPLSAIVRYDPKVGWTFCLNGVALKIFGENLPDAKRYVEAWFNRELCWKLSECGNYLINTKGGFIGEKNLRRQKDGRWGTNPPIEDPLLATQICEAAETSEPIDYSAFYTSAPATIKVRKPRGTIGGVPIY